MAMAVFLRHMGKGDSKSSNGLLSGYQKPKLIGLRIFTVYLYTVSFVFLILVEIGNIANKALIRDTYWLKIGLANVIPNSIPNAVFINSMARSIGLHDFYQVGLWGFCEGYDGQGITDCSKPKTLYWFNPVEIIMSELLAGASIALPTEVTDALQIVRVASRWMFTCYLIGISLTFLCIFFVPMAFSKKPRWSHKAKRIFARQLPLSVLTFLALLLTAGPSVIGTAMFVIFRNTFSGAADLNITAHLGTEMLVFTWISTCLNLCRLTMVRRQVAQDEPKIGSRKNKRQNSEPPTNDTEEPCSWSCKCGHLYTSSSNERDLLNEVLDKYTRGVPQDKGDKPIEASLDRIDIPPAYMEHDVPQQPNVTPNANTPNEDSTCGQHAHPNDETYNDTVEQDVIDLEAAIRACQLGERGAKRQAKLACRKLVRDLWTLEVAKYGGPCGMSRWDKKQMKAQAKALKWTIKAEIRGGDERRRK
ncbi:hypothetical protein DV736_g1708, partial [Chaetothyriales sp. CBS 134916]